MKDKTGGLEWQTNNMHCLVSIPLTWLKVWNWPDHSLHWTQRPTDISMVATVFSEGDLVELKLIPEDPQSETEL
jgi:hypothetical protein